MKELLNIYSFANNSKKDMAKAIIWLILSGLLGVVPYFFINNVFICFYEKGEAGLAYLGLMSGLILISLFLKTRAHGRGLGASHYLAYNALMGLREKMVDKLLKIPMGKVSQYGTGNLKKIFVENIEDMELILAHMIPEGVANIVTFIIVLFTLILLDWRMALLAALVLPVGLIAVFLMLRAGKTRIEPYYQASKEMNENIIEYIYGMEVIKVFGQTTTSYEKYSDSVNGYKNRTLEWFRVSWTFMVMYSVILPSTLLFVLPFGTLFYIQNTLTFGTYLLAILLSMSIGPSLVRIVEFIPKIPQLGVKAKKIKELLDEIEFKSGMLSEIPASCDVCFEDVTFSYEEHDVIRNVSFVAQQNSVTALVGASGSGKSTIAKLLLRFWDVKSGIIKIGDTDICNLSMKTLTDTISYVSQDIILFNTTIIENIRMGNPDASDEEIVNISKAAQCHEFIMETSNGYQTVIGWSGEKLSGGQRQRIAIARAMLKNAPIVVLDEATSFSDPENEDNIQRALNGLIQGKTLIVIAHRLSTIIAANNIVVLEDGKISAQGTHEELLKSSSIYQKLWNAHSQVTSWNITTGERG